MRKTLFSLCLGLLAHLAQAQTDTTQVIEEEETEAVDYSKLVATQKNRAFCSARILGQSPQKLFTLGYDWQTGNTLTAGAFGGFAEQTEGIAHNRGLRLAANYPVLSRNSLTVNLGLAYSETAYQFDRPSGELRHPLLRTLQSNGLRSTSFNTTVFKPLNAKHFLLFQAGAALNGDYTLASWQPLRYLRYSGAALFGWKKHDRSMLGLGLSRTYLGGALNYLPVLYYYYNAENGKWGLEILAPARAQYRRTFNKKNLLFVGYEFQGNTFRLSNRNNEFATRLDQLELRRAELRLGITYERALTRLIWLSVQAGYRYNWEYNVDNGDFFRSLFANDPFVITNQLTNPLYFTLTLNWVSP